MGIIKTIADFFKNTFKKSPNNQYNSDNRERFNVSDSNNLKNSETMPAQFVRLGHYKAKSGGMSEDSIRMIRVLANDPKNPDMWILADGSKKSSYEILQNYEYMNTSHEENPPQPMNPLVIGDLGGIPENFGTGTADPNLNVVRQTTTAPSPEIIPPTYPQQPQQPVVQVVEKRVELEQQIIDKCETLEIHEYTLKITVTTNLDFEKLKTSIDILGLDKELVAQHVLQKLQQNPNNDINKMVSQAIVENILNPPTEKELREIAETMRPENPLAQRMGLEESVIREVKGEQGWFDSNQPDEPQYPETQPVVIEPIPEESVPILYGLTGQVTSDGENVFDPENHEESNMDSIDDFLKHLEQRYDTLKS